VEKFETKIMVVDRATLFSDQYFQGFSPAAVLDYEQIILDNYFYDRRGKVETMPQFKQPIAYILIVNKTTRQVFAYQRSSKEGQYNEKRLAGKWSWGIGGHIDKIDLDNENPILASLQRELEEEVEISSYDPPKILGYINDDTTEVGQVHFGLLYLITTDSKSVRPRDGEIAWGGFLSVPELQEIGNSNEAAVESWSLISLTPLIEALGIKDIE
jgi:predicted NUDIX family phosphoesterase